MARSSYDFFLGNCLLPVTPQKLQVNINNANETITLINGGEINILKKAQLTDIEFECLIPQVKYPFAVYKAEFQEAQYFLDYFEKLKNSSKPFQFLVTRKILAGKQMFDTNMKVSMEEYKITEDAKNGFDITVKVKLKQWKDYSAKTITLNEKELQASVDPGRETENAPGSGQLYTVVKGDCLWNIAKKFYGKGSKYTIIYEANKSVIDGSPNLIYPGQILEIPAV